MSETAIASPSKTQKGKARPRRPSAFALLLNNRLAAFGLRCLRFRVRLPPRS